MKNGALLWLSLGFCAPLLAADNPAAVASRDILTGKSWYRVRQVTRPVAFVDATNSVPRPDPKVKAPLSPNPDDTPPPESWKDDAFDDSTWPRLQLLTPGNVLDRKFAFLGAFRMLLRARFEVTDPAAVQDLTLNELRFEGGVVVYLNGREVARAGMPEGALAATTVALTYPDDVWLTSTGKPIPANRNGMPKDQREECEALVARRMRTLAPVVLPMTALRKGVNVLAIEIRRSDSHPRAAAEWAPIHLQASSLRLTAAGTGIASNTARPQGMRVWVEDINNRIGENDWADPCEPVGPVRFTGARNGSFGAMLVVAQPGTMKGAQVAVSDLRAVKGGGSFRPRPWKCFRPVCPLRVT